MKKLLCFVLLVANAHAKSPELGKERVVFRTDFGDLVFALYPKEAPKTVAQFLKLVKLGVYDSTHFFRLHTGFVAQVSDAHGRQWEMTQRQADAIQPIPAEFSSHLRHEYGALSMAHYDGKPDSGAVSFSILLGPGPHLDGKYTIFGEMEKGRETLARMLAQPRTDTFPMERIQVRSAQVAETPEILQKILDEQKLAPPRSVASVAPAKKQESVLVWALGLIAVIAAVVTVIGQRMSGRSATGLHWVILLICIFALTVTLGPLAAQSPLLGAGLCLSLLGTFRLFSRFETH